jgi:hypothetical protein
VDDYYREAFARDVPAVADREDVEPDWGAVAARAERQDAVAVEVSRQVAVEQGVVQAQAGPLQDGRGVPGLLLFRHRG